MTAPVSVVYDVNVLVRAAVGGNNQYRSWPSPPPTSDNPCADCIGVAADAEEFGLWLSPHILNNTARVLHEVLSWKVDRIERHIDDLVTIAEHSGAGVIEPEVTVTDCPDWEDNQILALAADVGAILIVSDDTDLTSMSPWRGTPILRPKEFVARVDGIRRHRRTGK
jgi:predicted nucleic acid-binding protein